MKMAFKKVYRNSDTEAASVLFPFDESELFQSNLVLVDKKWLSSHNEFIVGQTGSRSKTVNSLDKECGIYENGI